MREVQHVHPLGEGKEWPAIRDTLRTWRNENERCSDKVSNCMKNIPFNCNKCDFAKYKLTS